MKPDDRFSLMARSSSLVRDSSKRQRELSDSGVLVTHLRKRFSDGLLAIDDCSMSLAANEIVALVGPSGCGKTTLLKVIAGLTQPTAGSAVLNGTPITQPAPERAVVFQDDSVFPWLTVRGNLEYGPKVRGLHPTHYEDLVDELLVKVGLDRYQHLYPRQLSGGMKKRVDVARAYANDPEVLLMDEPFGALDYFTKEQMQIDLLHLLAERAKSALFITHDIEEAIFIADRVLVMSSRPGRILHEVETFTERNPSPAIKTAKLFQQLREEILAHLTTFSATPIK